MNVGRVWIRRYEFSCPYAPHFIHNEFMFVLCLGKITAGWRRKWRRKP